MATIQLVTALLILCSALSAAHPWRDPSPHAVRFADLDGLKLQYLDWGGKGDALLLLPGLGQSAHIFDGLAPQFTAARHVLALTPRGHGKSDRPASGYDTATLVEDVRRFLDAQKIQEVTLAGHSLAGNVLTEFAVRYPQRIRKLIYIEGAYDYANMPPQDHDPVEFEQPNEAAMKSIAGGMQWFGRVFGFMSAAIEADARDVNLKPDGTMTMESAPPEIMSQLWQGMIEYSPKYNSIVAPILAIYAITEAHPFLRADAAADLQKSANRFWQGEFIPYQKHSIAQLLDSRGRLQIVVLRNTKHLCFIAKQDEAQVAAAIKNFL